MFTDLLSVYLCAMMANSGKAKGGEAGKGRRQRGEQMSEGRSGKEGGGGRREERERVGEEREKESNRERERLDFGMRQGGRTM